MSKKLDKVLQREMQEKFCAQCGTKLPPPDVKIGYVVCLACNKKWIVREIHAELRASYHYEYKHKKAEEENEDEEASASAAGPTVHRKCAKCGNDSMSYATRQTRSADEGMTVFFTCTQCGHKDIEYT